jgi:hypothetical protein
MFGSLQSDVIRLDKLRDVKDPDTLAYTTGILRSVERICNNFCPEYL